ncbi:hypothetical protein FRX31_034541 [Thalictrum thalictroides]|uniref:GRF-type domain-containing protein n=1 Tax=Thalictrum thalictroides TaxID=46969 RepID=A0A7J6UTF0_THATH|nr:hypothetical protein FRX31_034541 [Thalictrum thalictroides]
MSSSSSSSSCYCSSSAPSPLKMAWTDENVGRRFFGCSKYLKKGDFVFHCKHFRWVDKSFPTLRDRVWSMYAEIDALKEKNEEFEITVSNLMKKSKKDEELILQWKTKAQDLEKEV